MKIDYTKELTNAKGEPLKIAERGENGEVSTKNITVGDLLWGLASQTPQEASEDERRQFYKLTFKIAQEEDLTIKEGNLIQKFAWKAWTGSLIPGALEDYIESCAKSGESEE